MALPDGEVLPRPAGGPRRAALATAIVVVAIASAALALTSRGTTTYAGMSTVVAVWTVAAGVSLVTAGLLVLALRGRAARSDSSLPTRALGSPESIAWLMLALSLVWFAPLWVGNESAPSLVRSLAMLVAPFGAAVLLHAAAALPAGRLPHGLRFLVAAAYAVTAVYSGVRALIRDPFRDLYCWSNCTDNSFLVRPLPSLARALENGWALVVVVLGIAGVVVAAQRWVAESPIGRRRAWPVLAAAAAASAATGATGWLLHLTPQEDPRAASFRALYLLLATCLVYLALAVMHLALREWRSLRALAQLSADLAQPLETGGLGSRLAAAVGDPGVTLAYVQPDDSGLVDSDGRPAPAAARGQATVVLERAGVPIAVIRHDPAAVAVGELGAHLGGAALLALDNDRLRAALLARVQSVTAARARLVETSDAERRRLERNLHDGAQQQLIALTSSLRTASAQARAAGDPAQTARLDAALRQAQVATAELREIAHGIYPAILAEAGLGAALEQVADLAPIVVHLRHQVDRRFSPAAEQAAYVVVVRAVAAVRDPQTELSIEVSADAARLMLDVDPFEGPIADELLDRVGALGGTLAVTDRTLRAEIPCA